MADPVRWGVLGTAMIADVCVIPAIQKSRNGTVHALASRSADRAEEFAAKFDIPHTYDSYADLLADEQIEAVYIPLPNHLHLPWTLRALAAGKHVLCEKPLALNADEAAQMVAAAEDADRLLMEAFMYRFHPRSQLIKRLISENVIGEPRLMRTAFTFTVSDEDRADNIRFDPAMGGGALMDVGCYGVSVTRWLFDMEPIQVTAQATFENNDPENGVDVHCVGVLRFESGAIATIEASFISALQQTYSVVGSRGAFDLPHNAFIPWEEEATFYQRGIEDEVGKRHAIPGADEYQLMVEHFARAIRGEQPLAFDAADSIQTMRVLDALQAAARSGDCVAV